MEMRIQMKGYTHPMYNQIANAKCGYLNDNFDDAEMFPGVSTATRFGEAFYNHKGKTV